MFIVSKNGDILGYYKLIQLYELLQSNQKVGFICM